MNQTLHIFLKDARRFWAEIVVSAAVVATFICICVAMHENRPDVHDVRLQIMATLAGLLMVLVPVSWWVLITRVIHAERLVGDTQFWITRPYVWSKLLLAKMLFLLAFLYLPFFIAQCLILAIAGFAPHPLVFGMLYNLLLLTACVILPLAAIATVTSSFARMTLTLLGIFLLTFAFATLSAIYFATPGNGVTSYVGVRICFALALIICSAAMVLQYALRKVWLSRAVLIPLPFLMLAAISIGSKYDQAQIVRNYPTAQTAPIQLSYTPNPRSFQTSSFQASANVKIPVSISLTESGVPDGFAVLPDAARIQIQAPDGSHWESEWQGGDGYKFLPGESRFSPNFSMPLQVFSKFQFVPLNVQVIFAITQVQAGKVTTIPMPLEKVTVPDFGICSPVTWESVIGQAVGISCISPLRDPPLTHIGTHWSQGPCSDAQPAPDSGLLGTAWSGSLDREPAQLSIVPFVDLPIDLSNSEIVNTPGGKPRYLCAGTPITFTQYDRVARMTTSVDIHDFHLPKVSVQGSTLTVTQ
jgi:hypothetical protein